MNDEITQEHVIKPSLTESKRLIKNIEETYTL